MDTTTGSPNPQSTTLPFPYPKVLLIDCDNTLTLTEEHAFAATAQTINTLLADFRIPRQSAFGNGRLTESALLALEMQGIAGEVVSADGTTTDTTAETTTASTQLPTTNNPGNSITTEPDSDDSDVDNDETTQFASYSSSSLLADYIGLPFRQILTSILQRHNLTLTPEQSAHYALLEERNVNAYIRSSSTALPGVTEVLYKLRSSNKFRHIAVVSSSPLARVKTALETAQLYPQFFSPSLSSVEIFSASDSLPSPKHKPDPAIYQHAVSVLGVDSAECIAVEDSVSGCLAAVRAGIRCLGFVGAYHDPGKRDVMRRFLLQKGACAVMGEWTEFESVLEGLVAGKSQS